MSTIETMSLSDIRRKYREGVPVSVLADLNGCEPELIRMIVSQAGEERRSRKALLRQFDELYRQGLHDAQIAERCKVSRTVVRRWRSDNKLPVVGLSPQSQWQKRAMDLYMAGAVDRKVALSCGVRVRTVTDWRHRNNLPPNGSTGPKREYKYDS